MPLTTKRALATSLKNMLSKKTLDKITVKDIVDDCSLNRHFTIIFMIPRPYLNGCISMRQRTLWTI